MSRTQYLNLKRYGYILLILFFPENEEKTNRSIPHLNRYYTRTFPSWGYHAHKLLYPLLKTLLNYCLRFKFVFHWF